MEIAEIMEIVEIATRNGIIPGSVGRAQAHPLMKPLAMRKKPSAGLGPVTVHSVHSGVDRYSNSECFTQSKGRCGLVLSKYVRRRSVKGKRHAQRSRVSNRSFRTKAEQLGVNQGTLWKIPCQGKTEGGREEIGSSEEEEEAQEDSKGCLENSHRYKG